MVRWVVSHVIVLILQIRKTSCQGAYAFIILIITPTGSGCCVVHSDAVRTVLIVSSLMLNPSN